MSSVLQQEPSAAALSTPVQPEQTNGHSGSCVQQQKQNNEKDVHYWQRSLEVLSQKVIVGYTANANNKKKPTLLKQEESEQHSCGNQDSVPANTSVAKSVPSDGENAARDYGDKLEDTEQHDSNLFLLNCCCEACLNHRETIIQLFVEDFEYNTLWERLQLLIKKFYDFIPDDKDSQLYGRYMDLMDKSSLKWMTDGRINTKKNIQISLGSNLPLSNEMTFILVFSMLYTRDPHQLFELLCLQLRSIVKAYSQGLQDLIIETSDGELKYNPTELVTYILDGYDRLLHSSKELTPLLFELQRGHLHKFRLTWNLINKRMYERFVYFEVQKIIPDCIVKLKELLHEDDYKSIVCRFIHFDNDMNAMTQTWCDAWCLLHEYHKTREDAARRKRIHSAHLLLLTVRESEFNFDAEVLQRRERSIVEWLPVDDRCLVWQYALHNLKTKWIVCTNPRLTAPIVNINCKKCNNTLAAHHVECICRTCMLAGGTCYVEPKKELYCAKCSFFNTLDQHYSDYVGSSSRKPSGEKSLKKHINGMIVSSQSSSSRSTVEIALVEPPEKGTGVGNSPAIATRDTTNSTSKLDVTKKSSNNNAILYHISWAMFKHIPGRQAYTWTTLEPKRFCIFQAEPCKMNACRIAINIIAMLYPLNLSKFLIKSYYPLKDNERRRMVENWNTDVKQFMQKFCDDINKRWRKEVVDRIHPLHFLDLLWEADDADSALLGNMASAFAEWFLIDFQCPHRNTIYQYFIKFFLAKGSDIEFDMNCFECISCSRLFNWCTPASPLRQMIVDDMHNKILRVNWSAILPEEALAAIIGCSASPALTACDKLSAVNSIFMPADSVTMDSNDGPPSMSDAVADPIVKLCTSDGSICKDCKSNFADAVTKTEIFEKEIKQPLVEALKLAASNKVLESELQNLQKEHTMLKDMVRDLEQIHEHKHSYSTNQPECNGIGNDTSTGTNSTNKPHNIAKNINKVKNVANDNSKSSDVVPQSGGAIIPAVSPPIISGSPIVKKSATTVINSPTKIMPNQSTCAPPKTVAHIQQSNSKLCAPGTSSPQTGKVVTKVTNTTQKRTGPVNLPPSPTTPVPPQSKVSSMAASLHSAPVASTVSPSTSISSNGTGSSTSPHAIQCKEEHKKACHRGVNGGEKGDGSCVCYYCTLFGQSVCLECNHNQRTNETRDRLRKKIKQLQSNKDTQQMKSLNLKNIKIPPGGLLKKINTNKSNSTNAVSTGNAVAPSTAASKGATYTKTEVTKNSNVMAGSVVTNLTTAAATTAKVPSTVTTPPASKSLSSAITTKMNGTAIRNEVSHPLSIPQQTPKMNINPIVQVKKAPPPLTTVEEQSLDDILKFIEGDDAAKQASNKKVSKKIKQKQKKHDLKKISELGELSQKFSEFQLEEQNAQKRLQFQQHLKKKDKNQLLDDIKAYEEKKIQLQTDINNLVSSIRSSNPDFSFRFDDGSSKPAANSAKESPMKVTLVKRPAPSGTSSSVQRNTNTKHLQKQLLQQQTSTTDEATVPKNVTVTAKGPSPDQDKLLCTFVNGQIFPANGAIPPPEPGSPLQQEYEQFEQSRMKRMFSDACDLLMKNAVTTDSDVMIAEKLLKLSFREQPQQFQVQAVRKIDELVGKLQDNGRLEEKKKENIISLISRLTVKLAQIHKPISTMSKTQSNAAMQIPQKTSHRLELEDEPPCDEGKKKKKKKKNSLADEINEIDEIVAKLDGLDVSGGPKKGADKKGPMKILNRKMSKDSISSNGSTHKMKDEKENKSKEKNRNDSGKERSNKITVKETEVKKKVVRKKNDGYIDPEFDNNTFKLLKADDSESEIEEEIQVEEEKKVCTVGKCENVKPETTSTASLTPLSPKIDDSALTPVMVTANKKVNKKKNEKMKNSVAPSCDMSKESKQVKNKENLSPASVPIVQKNSKSVNSNGNIINNEKPLSAGIKLSILENPDSSKRQKKLRKQDQVKTNQSKSPVPNRRFEKTSKNPEKASKRNDRNLNVNEQMVENNVPVTTSRTGTFPKIPNTFPPGDNSFGASIMDQLSRGIRVEGLQLPPGITLTRVDAAQAEAIKAKRESIKKICEPMRTVQMERPIVSPPQLMSSSGVIGPGMLMMNTLMVQPTVSTVPGQDAIIMVDTNRLKERATGESDTTTKQNTSSKKNKRKNKNKSKHDSSNDSHSTSDGNKNKTENKIVTLRNPMFHTVTPAKLSSSGDSSSKNVTMGHDQPAAIFKNNNGMFTIRNPLLHQSIGGEETPSTAGFRPFNSSYLVENGIYPQPTSVAPPNTTATTSMTHPKRQQMAMKDSNFVSYVPAPSSPSFRTAGVETPRKCNSVIGSEMKSAQKQKQLQHHHQSHNLHHNPWQQLNGQSSTANDMFNPLSMSEQPSTQRSYSPFERLQHGLSGSQDYVDPRIPSNTLFPLASTATLMNAIGSERSQARAQAAMSASANTSCRRLFPANDPSAVASSSSPHFSDKPPSGKIYDELGASASSTNPKYDDISFLQNLQPGQRLNSEVTIHNINESKFLRQQGQNLSNDIEITRIPAPGSSISSGFSHSPQTTRPLLMSPAGSTISSETAAAGASSSITGVSAATPNSSVSTATSILNDIDSRFFMQNYQQQQLHLQHQLQQQMQQLQLRPISQQQQQQLIGEYGENIFAPNQMVNLNELESEERDIESFKRFNYYFDPPKNKPKINLNVKDIVANSKKSTGATGNNSNGSGSSGSSSSGSSSSRSSVSNDNNPGGVSIGEDIQPIRPQAPIGTPSQKHLRQQQGTPVSSVGTGVSTMNYPATSDSPVSSVSIFDGVSSSMSSHAHSCDDLYNDLLTSTGNLNLNVNLNFTQHQQTNSDVVVYDSGLPVGVGGGAPCLASAGSSSSGADRKPTNEMSQSIISN
ncbi:uncharacterized protein LOC129762771 isoform X2 [Toxorhynchites rutilus septentrionalis]|uniref:uncharacterized protein LOC129762771 isoform X2 n=1 Tax=Toxorhynchites rutilus septentrionalis TaxID=329112 RepID=UPI00247AF2AC|nr:uncharacterized protein LOC129762771 isoform X2 [Toxorhynchites rutilus septentrionalis]